MERKKKKFPLHWQILVSLILAVLAGSFLPPLFVAEYVSWMGDIFLRLLKMLIIPLVFFSIISGISTVGSAGSLGRLGGKTILYYLTTSLFAILTGLILVNLIQPGVNAGIVIPEKLPELDATAGSLGETLMQMIPTNIVEAMASGNMLSVIFFAIILGFFITQLNEPHKTKLSSTFDALFELMMKVTHFVILLTPIGVFGIVAGVVSEQHDLLAVGETMGKYMLTVIAGLFFHAFVLLPLMVILFGRAKPYAHLKNMSAVLLTAFSTSSSGATLPLTMNAVETRSGVSKKICSFTLPLGATVNMDGTALYECVAALFIAQAYGIELGFAAQFTVVVTALLASIGAAGIPMAGLVMISIVLSAVGLPLEGVGLILAVDRILDMFRTAVNVWSDSCGAVIIAKTEGEELAV
ncbi:MAG: dicarboxylate/amino acid:cation symporter [Bacteroidetes bacterium]|nr:dicarboxylate/amino acid:cation symporter [Bacteroidota bacterium]MBU1720405.1 dicarboxylate/amino acid:cation symporter [Bacteroidota bacterium]